MSSLHELLTSNERIANSTLMLTERVNNLARKLDILTPKFERLALDLHDLLAKREIDEARMYAHFERLKEDLGKLDKYLTGIAKDVDDVQRDITGSFRHQEKTKDEDSGKLGLVVKAMDKFEKMKVSTQVLLIVFVVLLVSGGFAGWILYMAVK